MKRQALISAGILIFLLIGTSIAVLYGRGYRFGFERGRPEISGTGLLVTTSTPDSAQVFINGHLTTATNNTINLAPGDYEVRIFKEGYSPWEKKIKVQKEVVAKADATLYPAAPKLESLTSIGVDNPTIDPSGTRLAYTVASQAARKNGVYILDMTNKPILTLSSASTQIADDTTDLFSKATFSWSPDGQSILASISATPESSPTVYLLSTNGLNANPKDVTATLASVQAEWATMQEEKDRARLASVKPILRQIITGFFKTPLWTLDETRVLYQASKSGTLPLVIEPRLIGIDSTPEERTVKQGVYYVYDVTEDKNFKVFDPSDSNHYAIRWLPDTKHVVLVHDAKINVLDYDGTNETTVYSGPFIDGFAFPWPDGSRIVILTNFASPINLPNLYTIGLK